MVGIILASHGEFAEGILQSGQMIVGEQENVKAVTLMPSEGPDDIRRKMEEAIASFDSDEVLFLVDLWGGTPFNQANTLFEDHKDKWAIVAGLNLGMLIEAFTGRFGMDKAQDIAKAIIEPGKDSVKVRPESLQPAEAAVETKSEEPNQPLPEGTVVGTGKIDIRLARIDSRLLHGQVATAWSKDVQPTRIIVVSDDVAQDDLRKSLITQASPPGIKANVVPVDKMIEVAKDPRFGKTSALLLFENPQDALRVIEGGVEIEEVNVGSMAHSEGKVMINNVLSVDEKDVESFKKMKDHGVTFDVRKVPSDQSKDIWPMLKKTKYVD
ncbi:mannose/fructose/sorbose PTS transporter subunit IIB [Alkalibacterium putridalgicola]|jgi:PTS system mannose-specific IIB component|uniref:PTS system mannose-specific EIIAB component n=1 Tax=Alkalibacterium putridalgicola TaxID=426703 RepID=A0A1H7XLH8_9LACT|nr:mannose/fructose/sorbose PTS transporter subunit IIB [Alkalibacterium putridalgicola]GEK88706.1 PTS mannose transporter subunit EIIAB [Alkalibacterium putridalgicola]SEM34037.1 PTS system, mannose-specific IIB component [Alkalibacterium putridalgicola]